MDSAVYACQLFHLLVSTNSENIFSRSWGWWSRRAWWGSSSASWRAPRSAPPPSCSAGTPSSASAMAPTASYSGFEILIQCWSCSWPDLRVGNMRHTSLVEAHVRAILIRWYLNGNHWWLWWVLDKLDNLKKFDNQILLSQYLSKNALSKRVTAEGEVLPYHQEELDVSRIGLKSLFSSS